MFTIYFTSTLSKTLSNNILIYTDKLVKKQTVMIVKNAFNDDLFNDYLVETIIDIEQNSKGEILTVDFNLKTCYDLSYDIVANIQKELTELENHDPYGYVIHVPIGYVTNNPLFINVGPKTPLKISIQDTALSSIRTKITSFGINNALVEVYFDISVEIYSSLPIKRKAQIIEYETVIASKIVVGSVPNYYNGTIDAQSKIFNLPINE